MEAFIQHQGIVAVLNRAHVDTDQIIPKEFLKEIGKTGFGRHLFHYWRYLEDGSENPEFELNKLVFKGASILIAGDNFGCGSSREHAPWALLEYGFRVLISTSFADIFYNNCFKNGILPIRIQQNELNVLITESYQDAPVQLTIDLPNQILLSPRGMRVRFSVDDFRKYCLLKGLDDIAWTLQYEKQITQFEEKQKTVLPWLWV